MNLWKALLFAFVVVLVSCKESSIHSGRTPIGGRDAYSGTIGESSQAPLVVFPTREGRSMVYQYEKGSKDTVWLLIHGLGDEMSKLQGLAELAAQQGYGILRVDLQGHGETLKEYLKTHSELPANFDYQNNVEDIKMILSHLEIRELVIVGHSYGGGIAYALASALEKMKSIHLQSVHMLAPYVQRIDKFLMNYYSSPEYVLNSAAQKMSEAGVPKTYVDSCMNPFVAWVSWTTSNLRILQAQANRNLNSQAAQDQLLDPFMDQTMTKTFTEYFVSNLHKKEEELSESEKQDIHLKVQTAILVTKGIRSFDLLDPSLELPRFEAPLQVIGGEQDTLVLPAQLKAFDQRLAAENFPHTLEFIKGEEATHLFPRKIPQETFQRIVDFQIAQGKN